MTTKDYTAFADMLADLRADIVMFDVTEPTKVWERVVAASARIFAQDNPRFDENKYRSACGL